MLICTDTFVAAVCNPNKQYLVTEEMNSWVIENERLQEQCELRDAHLKLYLRACRCDHNLEQSWMVLACKVKRLLINADSQRVGTLFVPDELIILMSSPWSRLPSTLYYRFLTGLCIYVCECAACWLSYCFCQSPWSHHFSFLHYPLHLHCVFIITIFLCPSWWQHILFGFEKQHICYSYLLSLVEFWDSKHLWLLYKIKEGVTWSHQAKGYHHCVIWDNTTSSQSLLLQYNWYPSHVHNKTFHKLLHSCRLREDQAIQFN